MRTIAGVVAGLLLLVVVGCGSDSSSEGGPGKEDGAAEDGRVERRDGVGAEGGGADLAVPDLGPDAVVVTDATRHPEGKDDDGGGSNDQGDDPDLVLPEDWSSSEGGPPDFLPDELPREWTNVEDMDMVTVRKRIVIEFAPGTPMPKNKTEELWYNAKFESHVSTWEVASGAPGIEVKLERTWRPEKPGMFRRPALVLRPVKCNMELGECGDAAYDRQWLPTQPYRVTVWLGGELYERIFHTLPMWSAGYKITDFTVEAEQCERCFPYPVHVNVFVPPEYSSPDPAINNTSIPWTNTNQRYAVLVGLHTYNAQGLTLAETFGWGTLPRFSSQGVLEPILLVLPDATIPEPYCGGGFQWPVTGGKTCYTQFMGIPNPEQIPDFNSYTSYAYFMTHTMRKEVAKRFRIRGMDDEGNKLDNKGNIIDEENPDDNAGRDLYRRSWALTGCSGGGFGTPINGMLFPDEYAAFFALIGASPSMFNPWAYWSDAGPITYQQICNKDSIANYPYQPTQDGYRDLSMIDPDTMTPCPEGEVCKRPQGYCLPASECTGNCDSQPCPSTGLNRDITAFDRQVFAGSKSCFWFSPPALSNAIVLAILCGLDTTCRADQDAPDSWRVDFDKYPFDGNIMFTTGILDFEGPPAGFMDLDQQLDKRGVIHSFRYEDRGAIYHDWNAVHDYVEGYPVITRADGTVVEGNFPNTGLLYPFLNNAFESLGNYPFNHPFASEFTTGAMDPDRDYVIDLICEDNPELNFVDDNCPGVYNPEQEDSDEDGKGDACD